MPRIPSHSLETAPEVTRTELQHAAKQTPTGELLNLHAQMAHAPAVLASYTGIRKALDELGTFDAKTRTAVMLTVGNVDGGDYSLATVSLLAKRAGWSEEQIRALASGSFAGDERLAALLAVVREATATTGHVHETTWKAALEAGWSDQQLAEAFAYIGLILYVDYFVHYADTELDLPPAPAAR